MSRETFRFFLLGRSFEDALKFDTESTNISTRICPAGSIHPGVVKGGRLKFSQLGVFYQILLKLALHFLQQLWVAENINCCHGEGLRLINRVRLSFRVTCNGEKPTVPGHTKR